MAKVTVTTYKWDEPKFEPKFEVYEGDFDASVNDKGLLIVINNEKLKPSVKAIYANGTWDKVTLDD